MAKIITFLLLVISISANAQFRQANNPTPRTDIIRYDFNTYQGTPIKTGWLFDDVTYKKLYTSYNAADSLIATLQQYQDTFQKLDTANKILIANYAERIKDKDILIAKQNDDFKKMNDLYKASDQNVHKFEKQFVKIGGVYIHLGTAWRVAIAAGVVGWLIGKAQ